MTAMRMATTNEPTSRNYASNMNTSKFPPVNPASSYQTATPQQLQAAGIQPVVINDRQQQFAKQRLQKQNSQPLFGAGLSHIEESNYYNRPSPSTGSGMGMMQQQSSNKMYGTASSTKQQPQSLSPYHQQILVGAGGNRNLQSTNVRILSCAF